MNDLTWLPLAGAFGFGALIGWYVYYVNRYRRGEIQLSDVTTLVGVIGGASVLAIFDRNTPLFGAYGIGLFVGFFGYLVVLSLQVRASENFDVDFLLDGRRKKLADDQMIPGDFQQPVRTESMSARVARLETQMVNQISDQALRRPEAAEAVWAPTPAAQKVIDACNDAWNDETKADCNKYVKAVASALAHPDFGAGENANAIAADLADTNWLSTNGWTSLTDGVAAKAAADKGLFVVGAISGGNYVPPAGNGHVVVVVSSAALHKGKYPFACWGKLDSVGEQNAPVTHAYNAASVDKVVYASRGV
ncbi:hypothetical protein [Mesorhizobium sp. M0998]|uniref:hypothetical protein n=1 Tax=Mesorhizobium sp. M0998 TaxID=2957044 RepID=UPI003338E130